MQNHQIGSSNRGAIEGMLPSSGSYFPPTTDIPYLGQ